MRAEVTTRNPPSRAPSYKPVHRQASILRRFERYDVTEMQISADCWLKNDEIAITNEGHHTASSRLETQRDPSCHHTLYQCQLPSVGQPEFITVGNI